jgi:ATP-dependent 26S proteasome regulatory subunit
MHSSPPSPITLAAVQQRALDRLFEAIAPGRLAVLIGGPGTGKTTLLRAAHERLGGTLLGAEEMQTAVSKRHPLAIEDALYDVINDALDANDIVFVDDVHLVTQVVQGCHMYPRGGFINLALAALTGRASAMGRTLVVGTSPHIVETMVRLGERILISEFEASDYRTICGAYLTPDQIRSLDFAKIHRFARRMSASQLRRASESVRELLAEAPVETATDVFIDYLRSAQLVSNVDLREVQSVSLGDLKGLDNVIRALEANVILPLEHSELATELALKPKRGVLLVGPPGTGKTTIGRALAHRLRGKFFLVDGTVIAGTPGFYPQLHHVFEAAMRNAPAVVFIDDSDVIFEGQDPGLYRYLLTMLDGLESESAGGVCLVLTAMDIGGLPPALVRSGRIELWLETELPDAEARASILRDRCAQLPDTIGVVDIERLAAATEQLSGADLKRVVEDGKLLYAFDRARGSSPRPAIQYFLEALETVRANKLRYAQAEAVARHRRPSRPSYFDVPFGAIEAAMGGMGGGEQVTFVKARSAVASLGD